MKNRYLDPLSFSSDQISIPIAATIHKDRREIYDDMYCHMLIEDLSLGIVPIPRAEKQLLKCSMVPDDEKFRREIIQVLPTEYGNQSNLSEVIADSTEYIARHLAYNGICIFEIVKSDDRSFKYHFQSRWRLQSINPATVLFLPKRLIQFYPAREWRFPSKFNLLIPKSKCMIFSMPDRFGGPKGYRRLLSKLAASNPIKGSSELIPLSPVASKAHYDFMEHHRITEKWRWKLMKNIAWHFRADLGTTDNCTQYFIARRMLQFRRTQLIIRDSIIQELKRAIPQIAKGYGLNVSLQVEVPKQLSEIDDALHGWQRGEIDFDQINKLLR